MLKEHHNVQINYYKILNTHKLLYMPNQLPFHHSNTHKFSILHNTRFINNNLSINLNLNLNLCSSIRNSKFNHLINQYNKLRNSLYNQPTFNSNPYLKLMYNRGQSNKLMYNSPQLSKVFNNSNKRISQESIIVIFLVKRKDRLLKKNI